MRRSTRERCEPLDDLAAAGADVLPFHREQPELAGMEEHLDHRCGREPVLLCKMDGVDPNQRVVACGTDEDVERMEQLARASRYGSELRELLRQQPLVNR